MVAPVVARFITEAKADAQSLIKLNLRVNGVRQDKRGITVIVEHAPKDLWSKEVRAIIVPRQLRARTIVSTDDVNTVTRPSRLTAQENSGLLNQVNNARKSRERLAFPEVRHELLVHFVRDSLPADVSEVEPSADNLPHVTNSGSLWRFVERQANLDDRP